MIQDIFPNEYHVEFTWKEPKAEDPNAPKRKPLSPMRRFKNETLPLLILGKGIKTGDLGTRESFADIAATVTELLGVEYDTPGKSFAKEILA